jgi:hypothetical protein
MTAGQEPSPPPRRAREPEGGPEPEDESRPDDRPLEDYTSEPIESDEDDDPSDSG